MSRPTIDNVRNAQTGSWLDALVAVHCCGYVFVNGVEALDGTPYTLCYPRDKAEEWVRIFPESVISEVPVDPDRYMLGVEPFSTDPGFCTFNAPEPRLNVQGGD